MAVLSFMVSLALDMVTRVAIAMWTSAAAGQLLLGENVVGGMNSMAMQQGGMGLILTTLILTAPPMAAMFFNGTLGQFAAYATVGAHLAPGQGQPQRGAYSESGSSGYSPSAYQPTRPGSNASSQSEEGRSTGGFQTTQTSPYQAAPLGGQPMGDSRVRQGSQLPGRETSPNYSYTPGSTAVGGQSSPPTQPAEPTTQPPPPPKDRT